MSSNLRAIIVDDDIAVVALHERFIAAHGVFDVVAIAHTGTEALALIGELKPDLVLLDFYLPGLTGLEVLRAVRTGPAHAVEVIAVTAARDLDSVRDARAAGVRHYLVKPFGPGQLYERLDEIARDRRRMVAADARHVLDQREIDAILTGASGARASLLPKGLSAETLDAVVRALPADAAGSATELGDVVGISRVAARRYLEYLVAVGRAERSLDYATAGRPSVRYRIAN